ncbi:MAG: hypothetical protein IKL48_05605 [Elusimicrobiaceae bacterium]|nr:hypothetical protein [Elusimicrobiaceae bacterium]
MKTVRFALLLNIFPAALIAYLGYKAVAWGWDGLSLWRITLIWGSWFVIASYIAIISTVYAGKGIPTKDILPYLNVAATIHGLALLSFIIFSWCLAPYTFFTIIIRIFWTLYILQIVPWICVIAEQNLKK